MSEELLQSFSMHDGTEETGNGVQEIIDRGFERRRREEKLVLIDASRGTFGKRLPELEQMLQRMDREAKEKLKKMRTHLYEMSDNQSTEESV